MEQYKYMCTDDTVKVGDKPLKHIHSEGKAISDSIMKDKKSFIAQFKK